MAYDFDRFYESKVRPSLFHGLWDGCQINVHFDDTIEDIVIYERNNKSHVSVKDNFNGILRNPLYV